MTNDVLLRKNKRRDILAIIASLFVALVLIITNGAKEVETTKDLAKKKVVIVDSFRSDLKEVSGLAIDRSSKNSLQIFGVSDSGTKLAIINLNKKKESLKDFAHPILDKYSLCSSRKKNKQIKYCKSANKHLLRQWESIATDAQGNLIVLKEQPANVMVLSKDLKRLKSTIMLDFSKLYSEAAKNKKLKKLFFPHLGEGIVLLKNGHLLVAKENYPASIVEFGPEGNKSLGISSNSILDANENFKLSAEKMHYIPLKTWRVDLGNKCDLSEIAVNKNNELFALSQNCRKISKLNTTSHTFTADMSWRLPKTILNPEALIILDQHKFIIGSDNNSKSRDDIYIVSELEKVTKEQNL